MFSSHRLRAAIASGSFVIGGLLAPAFISSAADQPFELILDNDNAAVFSEVGPWSKQEAETQGYNGQSYHYMYRGDGSAVATWHAEGIPAGRYDIQTTWTHHINRASNAPFTIFDGNTDRGTVRISEENVPQGFTVNGWPFQTLGFFDIASGNITIKLTNDANEYVISDTIRLVRVGDIPAGPAATFEIVLDNDNPAQFSEVGPWSKAEAETQGYNGQSYHYIPKGDGSAVATWHAEGLPSGKYEVHATWTHHINRASNAPFTIFDGSINRGTVLVSEENVPNGVLVNGWPFQSIGTFDITSGNVVITLTNNANEYVISDAIRLVRIGDLPVVSSSKSSSSVASSKSSSKSSSSSSKSSAKSSSKSSSKSSVKSSSSSSKSSSKNSSSKSSVKSSSSSSKSSSISSSSSSSSSNVTSTSSSVLPTPTPILFSLPDFPDSGRVPEGDWVKAQVQNGIPESAIYVDVLYDGAMVYSHGFAETDTGGNGLVRFQMPYKLLKSGHIEDGLVIRITHAEIAFNQPFTLTQGLSISVPKELKEGTDFTYEVQRSTGETAVEAGISYDAGTSPTFPMRQTDGSGNARITVKMPKLIRTAAATDGAEFWVKTRDVTWYFPITIVKADPQPPEVKAVVKKISGVGGGTIYPVTLPTGASTRKAPKVAGSVDVSEVTSPVVVKNAPVGMTISERAYAEAETPGYWLLQLLFKLKKDINPFMYFQTNYDVLMMSSSYAKIERVTANVNFPLGSLYLCTLVNIYSEGQLVDSSPYSCKDYFIAGSMPFVDLFNRSPESAPVVRRGNNRIDVLYRIVFTGPAACEGGSEEDNVGEVILKCVGGRYTGKVEASETISADPPPWTAGG